ncbi:hypothetical protein ACFQ1S_31475 [Kibdelosporangium lantanae]|uniref:Uncharacterized protein n=1 Tax=Kibdelosporangium lantanae TaxID=1497396 RepID=A0ABW3MGB9_9PSEU
MAGYHVDSGRRTAANIVNLVGTGLALVLVAHIVFVLAGARPDHPVATWAASWSDVIGLWFTNMFSTGDSDFTTVLNYGSAAVFWLVVTGVVARVLRNVG